MSTRRIRTVDDTYVTYRTKRSRTRASLHRRYRYEPTIYLVSRRAPSGAMLTERHFTLHNAERAFQRDSTWPSK